MIEQKGECQIEEADDMNIPVNIFISAPDNPGDKWTLTADNFMPRKCHATDGAYSIEADTREELQELVKKHVLPLYEVALDLVKGMIAGTNDSLYYWEKE